MTSHEANAIVGLVAGSVDGKVVNIGVNNGIMSFVGANTVTSDHVLIGKTEENIGWAGLPTKSAGGDLVIAPSGLKEEIGGEVVYSAFTSSTTTTVRVPGSSLIPDTTPERYTAYYNGTNTASLNSIQPKPQPTTFYKYNGPAITFSSGTVAPAKRDCTTITSSYQTDDEGLLGFVHYLNPSYRQISSYNGIQLGGAPVWTGITSANQYPQGGIWFQPLNTGECYVAFGVQNQNTDSYISIYRYKRNSSGAIIDKTELTFKFTKNVFSNKEIILFPITIDDASYEYFIAQSTQGATNPASLFFLKLAGSNEDGGSSTGGEAKVLKNIEFVPSGFDLSSFANAEYEVGRTDLCFTGTSSNGDVLHFEELIDNKVHYTSLPTLEVKERIAGEDEESILDNGRTYTSRDKTK